MNEQEAKEEAEGEFGTVLAAMDLDDHDYKRIKHEISIFKDVWIAARVAELTGSDKYGGRRTDIIKSGAEEMIKDVAEANGIFISRA